MPRVIPVVDVPHEYVNTRHCVECNRRYRQEQFRNRPPLPVIAERHELVGQRHCVDCYRRYHREYKRKHCPPKRRPRPPVENLDREALAWAAGFYDGEGCFWASANPGAISMTIHQVDPRPLRRFHAAVLGVGTFRGPYQRPHRVHRENHSPMYTWSVQNHEQVQHVIGWLWEFLSEPKREQIDRYMDIWQARPRRRGGGDVPK